MSKKSNAEELIDEIVKILEQTAEKLEEQHEGKDISNAIDIDIVKTIKAQSYHTIRAAVKKHLTRQKKQQKEEKNSGKKRKKSKRS